MTYVRRARSTLRPSWPLAAVLACVLAVTGTAPAVALTPTPAPDETTPALLGEQTPTETDGTATEETRLAGAARAAEAASIGILAAGVPEAPRQVWAEGFDLAGSAIGRLGTYASGAYTGDVYWLDYANCNGVLVTYNTADFGAADCTSTNAQNQTNARINVRRLADVLGQVNAGTVGSGSATSPVNASTETTRANRAVAEWTSTGTGPAGGTRVIERTAATAIAATGARYYTSSIDIVEASCLTTSSRSQITLTLAAGTASTVGSTITACTDARASFYTSPLIPGQTGWVFGGDSVRAGRFTSDTSLLVPAAQAGSIRPIVRNANVTSGGNDFAVDNLRILDATPSLDKSFSPATVTAGTPSTLTFTVTNTSELASKNDWSFTDTLPSGLVVAPTPAVGGSCVNSAGAAFSVTAAAGSGSIAATGGDLAAGSTSCTITVNVVAAAAGSYVNGAGNVSTMLNAPEEATLVVEPPARITIQKNVAARATTGDQFRLALSSGATEVATATTTGSATGIQSQRVGPVAVTRGATYTISETVVSSASLNTYTTGYECVRGSTTIATGTSVSGAITIPDEAGAEIVCTFTNTPRSPALYCDGAYFYAVRANGSVAQVNAASTAAAVQLTGAVSGATDVNAFGIDGEGATAFAVDRTSAATNAAGVVAYTISGGALQATRTALTTAQGTFQNRAGTAVAGTIIGGAVDPISGEFIVAKAATGSVGLWEYTPTTTNNGSRFLFLGQVATGTAAGENGDIAFDAEGNLHIVQTAADSSNVGMFSVRRDVLTAATGGTIASSATVRRALSGTDANFPLTAVNGLAFSPRGTVYLGNGTTAYQFDPATWARVPNSPRATIGTTAIGAGSTDLAGCASPSTLTVEKNVVGRVAAADQFRLAVSAGSPAVEAAVATTTGNATGVQAARIGPMPVQINTAVTLAETMAAGSTSPLTAYTSVYECWADGVRIFTGTEKSPSITIPNRVSVGVACTFTNSPQPFATVRVSKFVEDWTTGARTATPGWTMTTTAAATTNSTVAILPSRDPAQQTGADGSATWQVLFGAASHRARITVAETTQTGFRYQSLVCTVNGTAAVTTVTTVDGQVRGAVNVDVGPGNAVECAFTNRPVATLSLVKNVSYGTADRSNWQLSATRSATTALPGPTGAGGSGTLNAATVSAGVAYRLSETGGPATYVQVGGWTCVTATGAAVPVSAAGDVTLAGGSTVTCTVTNATASLTLLKNVQSPSPGFEPSTWNVTATPATLAGLSPVTRFGADFAQGGNAASTFDVRPGHSYTLSETLATPGTRLAYRQVRLEVRQPDGTWTAVTSPTITAPAAGQSAIYRFVNAPVQPTTLPLTGGASTDAFLISGGLVLTLALALALWHARRRRGASQ